MSLHQRLVYRHGNLSKKVVACFNPKGTAASRTVQDTPGLSLGLTLTIPNIQFNTIQAELQPT